MGALSTVTSGRTGERVHRSGRRAAIAFAVVLSGAGWASAETPYPPLNREADSKYGAILCSWSIAVFVQRVGETCFPHEKAAVKAALADNVRLTEEFILRNSAATREDLDRLRSTNGPPMDRAQLCDAESIRMYKTVTGSGAAAIRRGTVQSLSIPRQPSWDPCL
jgi:hypothetical protein